jgi:hypothetical protein
MNWVDFQQALNACLDRITEMTDEVKKLLNEFEQKLIVLKGCVDDLEANVGDLEANQFSTATKLAGSQTDQTATIKPVCALARQRCCDDGLADRHNCETRCN